jgi:PEP-CTERM motif
MGAIMKKYLSIAAAAACLAILPTSANAATVMVNAVGFDTPGYRTGKITYAPTNFQLNNVGIGRLKLSGTDLSTMTAAQYLTYCVDIFHNLHTGQFTMPGLPSYVANPLKRTQLASYVGNASGFITSAVTAAARKDASAAVQMGVWEILYEGSGTFNLGAGDFSISAGDSATARALANGWLGNVTSGSWQPLPHTQLGFLYNQANQSQIFLSNVPEPATWAMLLIGFGMIGASARRNSSRRAFPLVLA